jgi:hypothetical protein
VITGRKRLLLTTAAALASFVMQAGLRSPCGCPPHLLLPRVSPCARAACGTDLSVSSIHKLSETRRWLPMMDSH